jgi:hypothetical protein
MLAASSQQDSRSFALLWLRECPRCVWNGGVPSLRVSLTAAWIRPNFPHLRLGYRVNAHSISPVDQMKERAEPIQVGAGIELALNIADINIADMVLT